MKSEKFLVSIEFRFGRIPETKYECDETSRRITVGIYDTMDKALEQGNKALDLIKEKLGVEPNFCDKLRENYYSYPLVVFYRHMGSPFDLYVSVKTLKFDDIGSVVDDVIKACEEFRIWDEQRTGQFD